MRLTFLGTASGTEPIEGYHHSAFAIEHGGGVYWFDAGENSARRGHLSGLDLLSLRAVFISHPHMDHIGGLANLFWNINKLRGVQKRPAPDGHKVQLYVPDIDLWHVVRGMLDLTAKGARPPEHPIAPQRYHDGLVHEDEHLRVTAMHNRHLGEPEADEPWRSFSLRIESAQHTVVFSGDVRDVSELDPWLDGCDLLLMETGHHKVENVCEYLRDRPSSIGQLGFVHHGRAILADPDAELRKARDILGPHVFIAQEGERLTLD